MKSFRQHIREEGPANGTGVFTYGLGFFADMVAADFDVGDYAELTDDGIKKTKLPWELENAINAERRQEQLTKWAKAAGANSKQVVGKTSIPQVPNWQTAKR
jgi:hypothetical protein